MAGFSDYLENAALNHFFRNVSTSSPATVYCALFTAAPADSGGGTEVTGGSYARTAITFGAPSPAGTISNSAAVTFPTATAGWGTVTHFAVFDASSGGNQLGWAALGTSKTIASSDTAEFAIGQLTVTLD